MFKLLLELMQGDDIQYVVKNFILIFQYIGFNIFGILIQHLYIKC